MHLSLIYQTFVIWRFLCGFICLIVTVSAGFWFFSIFIGFSGIISPLIPVCSCARSILFLAFCSFSSITASIEIWVIFRTRFHWFRRVSLTLHTPLVNSSAFIQVALFSSLGSSTYSFPPYFWDDLIYCSQADLSDLSDLLQWWQRYFIFVAPACVSLQYNF